MSCLIGVEQDERSFSGGCESMSVQFGIWNFDGKPLNPEDLDDVRPVLAPYGPDGEGTICRDNFAVLYGAFHATEESCHEVQPHVSESGAVLTWDGRLDNRPELITQLSGSLSTDSTDPEIAAAGFDRWGIKSFARFSGDWALSVWDRHSQSLLLAKDPIGARHLYYKIEEGAVIWSTILDPLVLFSSHTFSLCEEYIAGCLSFFPAAHLTPYLGIHSVPPSSLVRLRSGKTTLEKYWDFDPAKEIRYRSDEDYEEHFRNVFAESVRRRLRASRPILAELSGGMDSSAIVCMADILIGRESATAPRLDTISYFDDSEPNWNERPYFSKVEEKRGRIGCHIDVNCRTNSTVDCPNKRFAATPGSTQNQTPAADRFNSVLQSEGHQVVLSGTGGDEVLGGVPTPIPELADLCVKADLGCLAKQLVDWALALRKPIVSILAETVAVFLPPRFLPEPENASQVNWLEPAFRAGHQSALQGYRSRLTLSGPRPSFQENLHTLEVLRRQLASQTLPFGPPYERRYPYLDRELLQFLYAVPREQLVRPLRRRSLMRRALAGIVPAAVLNRQRKGFVMRGPRATVLRNWAELMGSDRQLMTSSIGIVDQEILARYVERARHGYEIPTVFVLRALAIEDWLRQLYSWNVVQLPSFRTSEGHENSVRFERRMPARHTSSSAS
jgi:asparagine synthase (glutamine-hydrolysing)